MTKRIFPSYDYPSADWLDPFQQLARRLDVAEEEVDAAFQGLGIPEWESSSHLEELKSHTKATNKAARHAEQLISAIKELGYEDERDLVLRGSVTVTQLEHLHALLVGDAENLMGWVRSRDRAGGKNPAAYDIAEAVRRIFRRKRWNITFSHTEGVPTSKFCQAVSDGIDIFGIRVGWRGPADWAHKRQMAIEHRRLRMKADTQVPKTKK